MAKINLSELIRQAADAYPHLAHSPKRMAEYLNDRGYPEVKPNLAKQVLKNLREGKGPGVSQPEPPPSDPLYVPQAVLDAVPRHDADGVWEHYESELDEASFDLAEAIAVKLNEWDRFFGGMLVDPDSGPAEDLRTQIKHALVVRVEGKPYPDERIMAEWIKLQDQTWNLGFKAFLEQAGELPSEARS